MEVAAGPVTVGNASVPAPAHCLVQGRMNERVSAVDGKRYAIGFEMRLPRAWNGRFFYQANGGLDGAVVPAMGGIGGGGPASTALQMGFAVISSDAGHAGSLGPRFGLDPQARLDYGYNAVAQLTPMAKNLIAQAYGRGPDRSYIGGCSNGGRHAMVAAARSAAQYDGVLAGNPGFNLPRAAVAQLYGAQQYAKVASASTTAGQPDLQSAFTPAELQLVADRVLARCDALDGAGRRHRLRREGLPGALSTSTPTCPPAPARATAAACAPAQKSALANVLRRRAQQRRQADLQQLPLRRRHLGRQLARMEIREPADARCGRGGLHLQHAAAGRRGRAACPSRWASTWTAMRR